MALPCSSFKFEPSTVFSAEAKKKLKEGGTIERVSNARTRIGIHRMRRRLELQISFPLP